MENTYSQSSSITIATIAMFIFVFALSNIVNAQHYTSNANGSWTTASTWVEMKAWESPTPAINGGYGSVTVSHHVMVGSSASLGSITLNINNGGILTVNGDLSGTNYININGGTLVVNGNLSGGSIITINGGNLVVGANLSRSGGGNTTVAYGSMVSVKGDLTMNARLQINRGGIVVIDGNATIASSNYLMVAETGTANASYYADLVVRKDLISISSGDIMINDNGRVAVFGSLLGSSSGGTLFTLNQNAQVYIHGDIRFSGGGDAIRNANSVDPFGFYVNGSVSNTGGGAYTTTNITNQEGMFTTNYPFAEWVMSYYESPMPVTLIDFRASIINETQVGLKWSTGSEYNNSHFVVLRSRDGKNWAEIGKVDGNGTSTSVLHYSFTDKKAIQGLSYYMIRQIDYDGKNETFGPIAVNNVSNVYMVDVFPNPTVDFINIDFSLNSFTESYTVAMYDLKGNLVKSQFVDTNSLMWDISNLKNSIYLLKISSESGKTSVKRIVKN